MAGLITSYKKAAARCLSCSRLAPPSGEREHIEAFYRLGLVACQLYNPHNPHELCADILALSILSVIEFFEFVTIAAMTITYPDIECR